LKSNNFEMLRNRWPELAALGGFAEAYAIHDPASALVKLRLFAENLTKVRFRELSESPVFHSFLARNLKRDKTETTNEDDG
jgi:hypothetical protein